MDFSSAYTPPQSIREADWDWRSASALSSAPEAESGWNLSPDEVRRFSLLPPGHETTEQGSSPDLTSVVVIEDNPADANLIREAFQEHAIRCELVMVPNGERAVEFIDRIDAAGLPGPGLIILDLNLPRVHGRDVLRHIRQQVLRAYANHRPHFFQESPGPE